MFIESFAKKINFFFRSIRYKFFIKFLQVNKKVIFNPANISNKSNILTSIMNKHLSDKGNLNNIHNYTNMYHALFNKIRHEKLNVFEVGIGSVDENVAFHMNFSHKNYSPLASLKGWRDYFIKSQIFGADIDKKILKDSDRIKTFYVDMLNKESIIDMWKTVNEKMDIIIDDGFHSFEANINFFENSIKNLNENGYFIIEDIHRKPSNIIKFYKYFSHSKYNFQIIDLKHPINISDNCLILIKKN